MRRNGAVGAMLLRCRKGISTLPEPGGRPAKRDGAAAGRAGKPDLRHNSGANGPVRTRNQRQYHQNRDDAEKQHAQGAGSLLAMAMVMRFELMHHPSGIQQQ